MGLLSTIWKESALKTPKRNTFCSPGGKRWAATGTVVECNSILATSRGDLQPATWGDDPTRRMKVERKPKGEWQGWTGCPARGQTHASVR
ncbi:MAG: hypothetical protein HC814_01835 [Rhodobacteraceae bacterium]|nr:hypothetical protein [Paracoccaceae bacterium]